MAVDRARVSKQTRLLICDDSATERHFLISLLADCAEVAVVGEALDGDEAVALAIALTPDVIVMDLEMPSADGVSATRAIRRYLPEVRIVAFTAHEDPDSVLAMIEAGANAYVVKDTSSADLRRALLDAICGPYLDGRVVPTVLDWVVHLYRTEKESSEGLGRLTMGIAASLAAAVEARDGTTGDHVQRVAKLARTLARHVAPELLEGPQLEFGPLLHDIGKLGVRDAVLRKPGRLSEEEHAEMRRHVEFGSRILEPIPGFEPVREVVMCHHERWDGGGYPSGLRGEEIPLAARLFSVCDSYDAMVSDRPYRSALSQDVALAELERGAGRQFDPTAVASFVDLVRTDALVSVR